MSNGPGSVTVALDLTAGDVAWTARGRPALLAGDAAYYQCIGNLLAAPPGSMLGASPDVGGNFVAQIGNLATSERLAVLAAQAATIIASDPRTLTTTNVTVTQTGPNDLAVAADVTTTTGLNRTLIWSIA